MYERALGFHMYERALRSQMYERALGFHMYERALGSHISMREPKGFACNTVPFFQNYFAVLFDYCNCWLQKVNLLKTKRHYFGIT